MIYLFSGDDAKKKLANYEKFVQTLPKDAEIFSITRSSFDPVQIESFYRGSSLFSAVSAVIFDGILEREETRDFILKILPSMGESGNKFIFLEGKLLKPVLDAFKKARAEILKQTGCQEEEDYINSCRHKIKQTYRIGIKKAAKICGGDVKKCSRVDGKKERGNYNGNQSEHEISITPTSLKLRWTKQNARRSPCGERLAL